jgi:serine/threonine protein phosphatase PrpC
MRSIRRQQDRNTKPSETVVEHSPAEEPSPSLRVNFEHRPGLSENADPLLVLASPTTGLCGVFDGLGSAGAEMVTTLAGPRSGAWVAARAAREAVHSCTDLLSVRSPAWHAGFDESNAYVEQPPSAPRPDLTTELRAAIQRKLAERAAESRVVNSGVKNPVMKSLPTTMAAAWFDLDAGEVTAAWAGDSRVYMLMPMSGLQQVTTDDLETNADALECLTHDSPMSNYISAGTDFTIHEKRINFDPPAILFAASDGCFGYVATPLHFELMLLSTMNGALSWQDWQERLQAAIERVAGDDASLAGFAVGWRDFSECREAYAPRRLQCADQARNYDALATEVSRLQQSLGSAKADLATARQRLWDEYRTSYESLLSTPVRDVSRGDGGRPVVPRPSHAGSGRPSGGAARS